MKRAVKHCMRCQVIVTTGFVAGFAGLTDDEMVKGFKKETNGLHQRETVIFHCCCFV